MKLQLLILLLASSATGYGQRELVHAKNPADIWLEQVSITNFNLPKQFCAFAGTRFLDCRSLQAFEGFIQKNARSGFRKLSTAKPFAEELNNAVKIKEDSAIVADSVIVVLKNFWLYRNAPADEMSCHIRAFYFTKRSDSFFFRGRTDSVFTRKALIRYEFQDLPALFVEDMLRSFNIQNTGVEKAYTAEAFAALPLQAAPLIDTPRADALFFSFADLVNNRAHKTDFSLVEFNDRYKMIFDNNGTAAILAPKIWGCWYKGNLYLKLGKLFYKTYAAENTFIIPDDAPGPASDSYSRPRVLNTDTGKLE